VASTVYVAFLRAINVGGNHMVRMGPLKERFERLGLTEVSTYINSGNVLFRSTSTDLRRLERKIDAMLAAEFKLPGKTVVRSRSEMEQLLKIIDQTWRPDPAWRYSVIFLRHTINSAGIVKDLAPKPEIERLEYCPGTLLWSVRIDGWTRTAMIKLPTRGLQGHDGAEPQYDT
jgi:uncharacterized protein (DUF1697 family)